MALTKQDLENIREIVQTELTPLDMRIGRMENDVRGLREQIQQLAITLDNFVKIMTDYKEEFTILRSEVDQIKKILKEKLGIEIAVQK